jgi:hypothetical protein
LHKTFCLSLNIFFGKNNALKQTFAFYIKNLS